MFGSTRRRSYRNWPRAKQLKCGGVILRGSCPTMAGWVRSKRIALVLIGAAVVFCLVVSMLGIWGPPFADATEGTALFPWVKRVASVHWFMRDLLVDRYPEIGRAIGYRVPTPIDWHMGGLGLILYAARHSLSIATGKLIMIALRPLFSKRFRVQITKDSVRVGGMVFGRTMKRDDNGLEPVRFRVVSPEEYFADSDMHQQQDGRLRHEMGHVPPAVVEITRGFERQMLVFARRADQAEAIVARCNHALLQTQPMLNGLPE